MPQALGRQRLASLIVAPLGKVREPQAIGFDDEEDGPPVFRLIGIRCARYACLYRRLWDAFVGGDAGRYGRVIWARAGPMTALLVEQSGELLRR